MTATRRSPRRRARELAVQGLYEWRLTGNAVAAIEAHLAEAEEFAKADTGMLFGLLRGAIGGHDALAQALAPFLDRPFDDVSPVEASILLLGAHELTQCPEVPYRVVINEAIDLAKAYGGTDGHRYINGVLDKLAQQVRAAEIALRERGGRA